MSAAAEIVAWTIDAGLNKTKLTPLVRGYGDRLSQAVPGLARMMFGVPTLHPPTTAPTPSTVTRMPA